MRYNLVVHVKYFTVYDMQKNMNIRNSAVIWGVMFLKKNFVFLKSETICSKWIGTKDMLRIWQSGDRRKESWLSETFVSKNPDKFKYFSAKIICIKIHEPIGMSPICLRVKSALIGCKVTAVYQHWNMYLK